MSSCAVLYVYSSPQTEYELQTIPNLGISSSLLPFHVKIRECSSFLDWCVPTCFIYLLVLTTNKCLITKSMHLERCSVPARIMGEEQLDGCNGVDVTLSKPDGPFLHNWAHSATHLIATQ